MHLAEDDPEGKVRVAAFLGGMQQVGWTDGRNVRLDYRWGAGEVDRFRRYAAELVALSPEVVLASTAPSVVALQQVTRSVPIVFVTVTDPVAAGFVASLARPGGNIRGLPRLTTSLSPKWLELLKEIAPRVTRVAVLRDPGAPGSIGQFGAIQAVAPSFGVELSPIEVRDIREMERAVTAFARSSNGGLIVLGAPLVATHRNLIFTLAARHRLPAVYSLAFFVTGGGLIS